MAAKASCPTLKFFYPTANPVNASCKYGSTTCGKVGWAHTGLDYPSTGIVMASADGQIVRVEKMSASDHGMGNNVVVQHVSGCSIFYSTYSHLASIDSRVKPGLFITGGFVLGRAGGTGYGVKNYWTTPHLHQEFKLLPVTGNPYGIGRKNSDCQHTATNAAANSCWGYVPVTPGPNNFGWINPMTFLSSANSTAVPR